MSRKAVKKCTDCKIKLTPENKTKRYHRCMDCERIRYKSVTKRNKEKIVKTFLKENPNIRRVEGFDGRYLVSNTGEVYSLNETGIKQLSPGVNRSGYHVVCLFVNGKASMKNVHRLVASAWIPNKYPHIKKIINHIDGNKLNNVVANLEWCTHKHNTAHALKTGLQPKGEQIVGAKLSEEKVKFIYEQKKQKFDNRKDRLTQKELAEMFGVTPRIISMVQNRQVWKHVPRRKLRLKRKLLIDRNKKGKEENVNQETDQ